MKQSQGLRLLLFSTRGCANETLRERFARNDCKYFCLSTYEYLKIIPTPLGMKIDYYKVYRRLADVDQQSRT
ncbi:MAG: hypothetical protein HWQ41_27470 [Nostoc sp. NOS(2021)]|uniref:hypothetical protein n=1 Tax=Nostoc sp. NOS(2021) TaxID=2815407 RepID=UPI0025D788A9|nr:hypothetical protein [Nostoc sp. NOS(2021)]MBN3898876.1 hypothetical protein [Nostoc sp. NOS(2021)]